MFIESLEITLFGMAIVFVMLLLIILAVKVIEPVRRFFAGLFKRDKGTAVSYTHLDVYKRQELSGEEARQGLSQEEQQRAEAGEVLRELGLKGITPELLEAVSAFKACLLYTSRCV